MVTNDPGRGPVRGQRVILLVLVLLALAEPPVARAAEPYDAVLNSPHNFFARSELPIGSRVCYGCHAEGPARAGAVQPPAAAGEAPPPAVLPPGHAATDGTPPPLWQREARPYASTSIAPSASRSAGAGSASTACLGCHDGVLGQEVHQGGAPDARSFDHPFNVVYPRRANGQFVPERPTVNQYRYWSIPDLRDGALVLPTGPTSSLLVASAPPTGETAAAPTVRTSEGMVQCDSCHDPHDNGSAPFLRAPAHDLCLICHDR